MERHAPQTLSPRERQILQLAAEGMTDKEIAARLKIKISTIGTYWNRIRSKIGAHSRSQAIASVLTYRFETTLEDIRQRMSRAGVHDVPEGGHECSIILEHAPDALLVVRPDGFVEYANAAARALFGHYGLADGEVHLNTLVPERFRAEHLDKTAAFFEHPHDTKMGDHHGTSAIDAEGNEFLIAASLTAISLPRGVRCLCAVRRVEN